MASFISSGKQIRLDHYAPKSTEIKPAIILVHGSGGPFGGVDPIAQHAAALGVHVFVVHYFERTGHSWVHPGQIKEHFLDWLETVSDALSHVRTQPQVDKDRVALLGFSLGAYLSVAVAAQDERVAALIDVFGGIPKEVVPLVKRMPPTLIIHGDADTVVPVSEAYELESVLKRLGTAYEIEIFSGQGHAFRGISQFRAAATIAGFLARQFQLGPVGLRRA